MNCYGPTGASDLFLQGQLVDIGSSQCTMLRLLGEGTYGTVALFKDTQTGNTMAVKIPVKDRAANARKELAMLEAIRDLDPDTANIVKFYGSFCLEGSLCLAFEALDMSLHDLVRTQKEPLLCREIRPVAKQLLEALDALKGIGIVHMDIKPDNVMVVSAQERPLRVKLIDFGMAMPVSSLPKWKGVQILSYRAPEVFLGQAFNEAIDVWSVGCVLAFLYLGTNMFPGHCEYLAIKTIFQLLGQPGNKRLHKGRFTRRYFINKNNSVRFPEFRLKTAEEYSYTRPVPVRQYFSFLPSSLDGLLKFHRPRDAADTKDRRALLDLLKELLQVDGPLRITPHKALQHSFLSTKDCSQSPDCSEATQNVDVVSVCHLETPEHTHSPSTASRTSLDLDIALREQLEVPVSPPAVSVSSLDSAVGLGEQLEVPVSTPAVSVSSLDSVDGLAELQSGSSDSASSDVQQEDAASLSHVQLSRSEGEPSSSASTDCFRRTLKRIRRFFKRVHKTVWRCSSPPTED